MTFIVSGGIEWEKDGANKVLTIRPAASPEEEYTSGQMKDYDDEEVGPWGRVDEGWTLNISDGVTSIGNYAFNMCSGFTGTLTIPGSVTLIGDDSFGLCSGLSSLVISNGVKEIGNNAFVQCSGFTGSLVIPDSVTLIHGGAFDNCTGFTSLTIGNGIADIYPNVFSNCSGLTSLTIGNSVRIISGGAFFCCSGLTGTLTIPSSVNRIEGNAFQYCSKLSTIKFLGNKPTLGNNAFELNTESPVKTYGVFGTWVSSETFPNYEYTKWSYNGWEISGGIEWQKDSDSKILTIRPTATPESGYSTGQMKDYASGEPPWGQITDTSWSLALNSGVTHIGTYSFYNCSGFPSLSLPDTITSIGDQSFNYCENMKGALSIPGSVEWIGSAAFGQTKFTSLELHSGLKTIGSYAFARISTISGSLTLPNTLERIEDHGFQNCTGLSGTLILPDTLTSIGNLAFSGCTGFTGDLTIPSGISSLEDRVFANCTGFDGVLTIPSSMILLGYGTFKGCYNLSTVIFEGSQPMLGDDSLNLDTRDGSTKIYVMKSNGWASPSTITSTISGHTIWDFQSESVKTISVKIDGAWKKGTPYIKIGGVWKQGTPYTKVSGEWK